MKFNIQKNNFNQQKNVIYNMRDYTLFIPLASY